MNFSRKHRKTSAVQTARPMVWVYNGTLYSFYALNIADLHEQVRHNLSFKAFKEGHLG